MRSRRPITASLTARASAALLLAAAVIAAIIIGNGAATASHKQPQVQQSSQQEIQSSRRDDQTKPNFLVIMADDQAMNTFSRDVMPNTFARIIDEGTSLPNGYAVPPLCCPARAGFQTGQYPHNHGVFVNDYELLVDKSNIISTWLDRAGYSTGLAGKYMNHYPGGEPAPGFDHWYQVLETPDYYNYLASTNGNVKRVSPKTYSTSAITKRVIRFADYAKQADQPFFTWASYYAPHGRRNYPDSQCNGSAIPLDRDWRRFRDHPVTLSPSYNEADVSDKPDQYRTLPPLKPGDAPILKKHVRCVMAAMQPLDRGVERIYEHLEQTGQLENTVIFYFSDNGYFYGDHRRYKGKGDAYMEALRVPMAVRVGSEVLDAPAVSSITDPVANIDLAPTMLDLAGASPCDDAGCRSLDGYSLASPLRGEAPPWPQPRPLLFEQGLGCHQYQSLLYGELLYTERMKTGPDGCYSDYQELYDLADDPGQLTNLLYGDSANGLGVVFWRAALASYLDQLRTCSGHSGANPC